MFLTVNGKEIIFSTFFWLSSSLKYPHCRLIYRQWGTNAWENLDYNIEIKLPTAYTNKNFINLGTVINSGVDHTKSATLTTTTGTKTTTSFTFTNIPLNANELRLFWLSFGQ